MDQFFLFFGQILFLEFFLNLCCFLSELICIYVPPLRKSVLGEHVLSQNEYGNLSPKKLTAWTLGLVAKVFFELTA
jgi:hypothetical protein